MGSGFRFDLRTIIDCRLEYSGKELHESDWTPLSKT